MQPTEFCGTKRQRDQILGISIAVRIMHPQYLKYIQKREDPHSLCFSLPWKYVCEASHSSAAMGKSMKLFDNNSPPRNMLSSTLDRQNFINTKRTINIFLEVQSFQTTRKLQVHSV